MIRKIMNTSIQLDQHTGMRPRLSLASSAERFALETFGLPNSAKTRHTPFAMLGMDSLDKLKLAMDFEREYDIHLSDEDVAATDSIGEVADLVAVAAAE